MRLPLDIHRWVSLLLLALEQSSLVPAKKSSFLWFSDIHLDPYYGNELAVSHNKLNDSVSVSCAFLSSTNPIGDFGCDSPFSLVDLVLEESVNNIEADFVIITGDFVRHNNNDLPLPLEATEKILKNVSSSIFKYHPNIPIVPSVGNNDVVPDYYLDLEEPDEMLKMVTGGLGHLLGNDTANFLKGGYYARKVSSRLTILSLNTILYSTNHQPPSTQKDPLGQFLWLVQQLRQASQSNTTVYIMGHIPPTVGSYCHTQLWQEHYLDRYYAIVGQFSHVVKGQLFGHLHSDEFRVHGPFPLFLSSSLTPIYGSNPSFRVVTYDTDTGALLDYQVHYLDLVMATAALVANSTSSIQWQTGDRFTEAFGVADMGWHSLKSIVEDLQQSTESRHWEALLTRLHVYTHGSEVCDATCRLEWFCTLSSMTSAEYNECLGGDETIKEGRSPYFTMALLLAALMVLATLLMAIRRYVYRRQYHAPGVTLQDIDHVGDETSGEQTIPEVT